MKIISLGLGVQSTALYFLSSMGIIPRVDYAVFADPGAESEETYKYLTYLQQWQKANNGIEIIVENGRNIYTDIIKKSLEGKRFASIPAFTRNDDGTTGILRRQCTNEYKIQQVYKAIRKLYHLKPYQRFPKTEILIGITLDEIHRAKDSREKWATNIYPFLNIPTDYFPKAWTRFDCITFYQQNNLLIPPKSSCVFCPFQSPNRWKETMQNPNHRDIVINVDNSIRGMSMKGMKAKMYLTQHCLPIEKVNFQNIPDDLFGNECEGYCGI